MSTSPTVLGIIPARFASTRFPGKPLAPLLGKTLIHCTYENALRCSVLDEVVVATDDVRIFEHVTSFGGRVVMTSEEHQTGTDRLSEVVLLNRYKNTQVVVNIQGDEPCLCPSVVEKAVSSLTQDSKAVMSTAAMLVGSEQEAHDLNSPKCVIDRNGYALYFSRALIPSGRAGYDKTRPYYKHIGLYVFKRDFLLIYGQLTPTPLQLAEDLEQLKVLEHGYSIKVVIVESVSLDVNVPEDIKKVETLCKQNTSS